MSLKKRNKVSFPKIPLRWLIFIPVVTLLSCALFLWISIDGFEKITLHLGLGLTQGILYLLLALAQYFILGLFLYYGGYYSKGNKRTKKVDQIKGDSISSPPVKGETNNIGYKGNAADPKENNLKSTHKPLLSVDLVPPSLILQQEGNTPQAGCSYPHLGDNQPAFAFGRAAGGKLGQVWQCLRAPRPVWCPSCNRGSGSPAEVRQWL